MFRVFFRLCRLFAEDPHLKRRRRRQHPSVALVGNAPLDEAARPGIAAADFVVRFNWMHHRSGRMHLCVVPIRLHARSCRIRAH